MERSLTRELARELTEQELIDVSGGTDHSLVCQMTNVGPVYRDEKVLAPDQ